MTPSSLPIPLFSLVAWWGGLGAAGVVLLAGLVALPGRRFLHGWGGRWLARACAGLPLAGVLVMLAGQRDGLLFTFPWGWLGAAGWVALAVSGGLALRRSFVAPSSADHLSSDSPPVVSAPASAARVAWGRLAAVAGWGCAGLWLVLLLLPAFCPSINYDALEYHVGLVPHLFEAGRWSPIPGVFYSAQPHVTEALYALGAIIEGDAWGWAPGVVQWLLVALSLPLTAAAARALGLPRGAAPWVWLAVAGHPVLLKLQLDRMSDWTGVVMLAAGVWAARAWPGRMSPARRGWWAGLAAGGAVAAKWTHAGTVAVPAALLLTGMLWPRRGRGGWKSLLAGWAAFAAAAAVCLGPWMAWLWAERGNPVAPFAARWFPSEVWTPGQQAFLLATHGPLSPLGGAYWANLTDRLLGGRELPGLPWVPMGLAAGVIGTVALLSLRKTLACPSIRRRLRGIGWALGGLIVAVLLWGQLRHAADRFLAPSLWLAVILVGWLLGAADRGRAGWLRGGAAAGWGLMALAGLMALGQNARLVRLMGYADHALGRVTRQVFWERTLGGANAELYQAANALPDGSRLVAVNEARRYPFRRPIALASVFDRSPLEGAVRGASSARQIEQALAAQGYTHLLANEYEMLRILQMHRPMSLLDDSVLDGLLATGATEQVVERYAGATEFSLAPLPPAQLAVYREFLKGMRGRAVWRIGQGPGRTPGMWIAPLRP